MVVSYGTFGDDALLVNEGEKRCCVEFTPIIRTKDAEPATSLIFQAGDDSNDRISGFTLAVQDSDFSIPRAEVTYSEGIEPGTH